MKPTLVVLALLAVLALADEDACAAAQSCNPWTSNRGCVIGNRMTLQILVDVWPDNDTGTVDIAQELYPICPMVDQFQGYRLNASGQFSVSAFTNDPLSTLKSTNLSVVGLATAEEGHLYPASQGAGQAMFTYLFSQGNNPYGSGCSPNQIAVVSTLMLNFTMTNGVYVYATNNGTVTGSPINSGFVPTCQGGHCLFGDSACIGPAGAQNCARCYSQTDNVAATSIKVWASYYGTDANGRSFTSNQDNPLNFLQYATESAYSTLTNSL